MTTKATDVLQRVVWLLQDESIRWSAAELVTWLNDAQTAAQALRPDVTEVIASVTLSPGALQSLYDYDAALPQPPVKLMKVTRNTSLEGRRRAIRLVSREIMDVVKPDWQSAPPATDAVNYMVDVNLPAAFWIYPPAPVGTDPKMPAMSVEIHYSAAPRRLDPPAPDKTWADTLGDISVRDRFAMVLVDYVLYRAYMKDAEFGGNGSRAKTHFDLFQSALMADVQGTMVAQPTAKQATA
ncbi:MAG TPA: DUF6682 family protein [Vicinamibacterales bacterium]